VQSGLQVIVGTSSTGTTTPSSSTTSGNPLQPQTPRRGGPGGF
jgi:hypothetical protein